MIWIALLVIVLILSACGCAWVEARRLSDEEARSEDEVERRRRG